MKKQILCIASALMLTVIPSFAQSNNNVDEVVKIERHNAQAFREGEMIVKFKPIAPVRIKSLNKSVTSGVNAVDRVLGELGVTASEPLMPLSGSKVIGSKTLKSVTGKTLSDSDMSKLYRFKFDSQKMDVHHAVEKLSILSEVEFAEPNYVVYTLSSDGGDNLIHHDDHDHYCNEPLYSEQWGHQPLKMPFLWQQPKLSNKRPIIAIIDTGVDITHPDLVDNIWTNEAELNGAEGEDDDANGFKDDINGWDFVNQTARMGDWNGHGTHCAGIAAAVGKNGIGVTGANPDALIMPITVMQSDGTGDVATIIKGIDYAAANGADVISMSIGGYGYSIAEEQALAKAYSKAVLVAAAGNDYKCIYAHDCSVNKKRHAQNGPMYPAAFTFVLGVEASVSGGSLASFSNFDEDGPVFSAYNEEQLYNYELRAPGYGIMSTFPGGRYKKLNGTSMACPFVAGGVSRLLQCKEYANWEILFGDLIHTRKKNGLCDVDFEAAYKITDMDRQPSLNMVTYVLKDTIEGDGDGRPDAGETIAFYPTFRNEWGQARNIRFSLELGDSEDPTIVEFLDAEADFGKPLSSYGKNISANPLRFRVNPECIDGRHIRMVLRATCENISEELVQEFSLTAENGVEIGGMIMEDMTLYPNVHYIVTKSIAVPEGVTLTILPGAVLEFKAGTGMAISGNLVANGEPGNMIEFFANLEPDKYIGTFTGGNYNYCKFRNLRARYLLTNDHFANGECRHCIFIFNELDNAFTYVDLYNCIINSNTYKNEWYKGIISSYTRNIDNNIIVNNINTSTSSLLATISSIFYSDYLSCKGNTLFNNFNNSGRLCNYYSNEKNIKIVDSPQYWGTNREESIRQGILDFNTGYGYLNYDLSKRLSAPSAESHGVVWKIIVNGYDAQDEFEQLPPLGVGKHKFEVFFNRPMDISVVPTLAMGVRSPYTSHAIAEEGAWSADSLVYTAYLTINGKTGADGLNRIYVSGACDNEYFEIPVENSRFNVEVSAAGSMATGLMAEAGLGKVNLTWETDEEDFADLLGYNLYRYTINNEGVSSDSIIVNPSVLDADVTSYVDYDVVPGTTYYYVIKQLTTSLNTHALSNAVAATPLTAQKGDANGSMSVDIADVVTEVAYITYQNPQPFIFEAADVNDDEKVNVLDVVGTIGIITTPKDAQVNGTDNEPVRYYVHEGILYLENEQPLGGVQVRFEAEVGTEIVTLEALKGMEQTHVWIGERECLFLAYSMSGRTLAPGKHALLQIGNGTKVLDMVLSDAKGQNVCAIDYNTTGIGKVEAMQLQMPSPNPFTTVLNVPYVIGKDGNHAVSIVFTDITGRQLDAYHTTATCGNYTYTWRPNGLSRGVYLVSLYVDGKMMQSVKVICVAK